MTFTGGAPRFIRALAGGRDPLPAS